MTTREALHVQLNALLQPERFKDYCPNGLQVEGKSRVRKLVTGVTASLALIDAAIAAGADALLVHHGLYWRGADGCAVGWLGKRLRALLLADVSLFAYHLPLDAHEQFGNNATLGRLTGWVSPEAVPSITGEQGLLWHTAASYESAAALSEHLSNCLGRGAVLVPGDGRPIRRVAWCTGGAQGYFEQAIALGVDAYVTGELSEPQVHYAREAGVAFVACGHHATERYGVRAVGEYVANTLGVEHEYIEIESPA